MINIPAAELMLAKFAGSFRRRKGIVGTFKSCVEGIEDIWFDRRFGVDTLETVQDRDLPAVPFGTAYQPTKTRRIRKILRELRVNYRDFIFLDLGSGKGRVLLVAAEFPFRRIIGVEFLPELQVVAEKNIRVYRSTTQRCSAIESQCCDAAVYRMPPENTVLFLSNPFGHSTVAKVIENLRESLQKHPRQVYIVYHNPVCHNVIQDFKFLEVIAFTDLYAIYKCLSKVAPA